MTLSKLLSFVPLLLLGLVLAGAARSQEANGQRCAERSHVVKYLHGQFGERPIGRGLADQGVVFELYAGSGGSWTLFITTPEGQSCFLASGQAWEPVPEPDLFARR